MSRWLVLTACSIASLTMGCGSAITAGLANGPQLGGTSVADARVTDVVANGNDACRSGGTAEGSALRGKLPPCPTVETTRAVPVQLKIHDPRSDVVVSDWVRHFYVDWPCRGKRADEGRGSTLATNALTCGP
ncbi:MAG TPA: hypothetical protein VGG39_16815 [Polyangiaceae bacterium]|jgi:hypothetical protein